MHPLQWMDAVRMRVQTADKNNPQVIHMTSGDLAITIWLLWPFSIWKRPQFENFSEVAVSQIMQWIGICVLHVISELQYPSEHIWVRSGICIFACKTYPLQLDRTKIFFACKSQIIHLLGENSMHTCNVRSCNDEVAICVFLLERYALQWVRSCNKYECGLTLICILCNVSNQTINSNVFCTLKGMLYNGIFCKVTYLTVLFYEGALEIVYDQFSRHHKCQVEWSRTNSSEF